MSSRWNLNVMLNFNDSLFLISSTGGFISNAPLCLMCFWNTRTHISLFIAPLFVREVTFFSTFGDKTVGPPRWFPGESLIDTVFIGIIDSVGWLNVYVVAWGARPSTEVSAFRGKRRNVFDEDWKYKKPCFAEWAAKVMGYMQNAKCTVASI